MVLWLVLEGAMAREVRPMKGWRPPGRTEVMLVNDGVSAIAELVR